MNVEEELLMKYKYKGYDNDPLNSYIKIGEYYDIINVVDKSSHFYGYYRIIHPKAYLYIEQSTLDKYFESVVGRRKRIVNEI